MIWCRFAHEGRVRYGALEGEEILVIEGLPFARPSAGDERLPLDSARLLPPTCPTTFFCVGLNYRAHIEEARERGNTAATVPERPEIGYRANNALIGHRAQIVVPSDMPGTLEAEPEVVAVIGRHVRNATREEAHEAIFGWTIGNDVSARGWQHTDRTNWRSKNCDTFKPMGPWIVTDADPDGATTRLLVNGAERGRFATGEMIFDAVDYIVAISRYSTLVPGDVIWMGADRTAAIAPGDTVDIEITGIGRLSNPVVAEAA
jgi:2-keto-4-pentenoate hydratase/2-oxohepta-3-ene-1,7-dioic acid hydratase in catechol pathway